MIKTVSESSNYRLASEHYQIHWCKNKWRKDWTYNFQDSRLKLTLKLIRWLTTIDWLIDLVFDHDANLINLWICWDLNRYFLSFFLYFTFCARVPGLSTQRSALQSWKSSEAGYNIRSGKLVALLLFSFKITYHCLGRMTQYWEVYWVM
jgi:hypothetical protein